MSRKRKLETSIPTQSREARNPPEKHLSFPSNIKFLQQKKHLSGYPNLGEFFTIFSSLSQTFDLYYVRYLEQSEPISYLDTG